MNAVVITSETPAKLAAAFAAGLPELFDKVAFLRTGADTLDRQGTEQALRARTEAERAAESAAADARMNNANVRTLTANLEFQNSTDKLRVLMADQRAAEQRLAQAVVHELFARTQDRVVSDP